MLASANLFVSDFLSFTVVSVCFVSKLPQILRVINKKSADGKRCVLKEFLK